MAITLSQLQPAGRGFINNGFSADASGTETVVPAVAGKSHYIKSINISCGEVAITATIQDNTGTPVVLLGPVAFLVEGLSEFGGSASYSITYPDPLKVDSGKSIDIDTSTSGAINVVIQGYTE